MGDGYPLSGCGMNKKLQFSFNPEEPHFMLDADFIGLNAFHLVIPEDATPNIVGWMQIHREEDLPNESPKHLQWLAEEHAFPIYMNRKFDEYPASIALPKEDLLSLWPYDSPVSVSCTFSWAIALGIHLGYDEICFYNVYMQTPREAYLEAPNLMLWVGAAWVAGVSVRFMEGRLEDVYDYGFESRGIPSWAPSPLIMDLIVDYVSPEARIWRKVIEVLQYAKIYDVIVSKENALRLMEDWENKDGVD